MQCLPGPSLPIPGPMGVWVGRCGPALHTVRADHARAISPVVPHPTHVALALHTNSPCVNVASIIRLPQLRW